MLDLSNKMSLSVHWAKANACTRLKIVFWCYEQPFWFHVTHSEVLGVEEVVLLFVHGWRLGITSLDRNYDFSGIFFFFTLQPCFFWLVFNRCTLKYLLNSIRTATITCVTVNCQAKFQHYDTPSAVSRFIPNVINQPRHDWCLMRLK